jgi:hypothetical protein
VYPDSGDKRPLGIAFYPIEIVATE